MSLAAAVLHGEFNPLGLADITISRQLFDMVSIGPLRCPPAPPAVDKKDQTCREEEQRTGFGCRHDKKFLRTTAIWGNYICREDLIPRKLCQRDRTASV